MNKTIRFRLNGHPASVMLQRERTLLWVLRTDFELTGTKYGCGEGFCGACTVLVDGEAIRSCQFPLSQAQGREVLTIEGLSTNGRLHPLQQAFIENDALQCGFCTPGMIMNAHALLLKNPRPTRKQILEEMEGNICRCGTYKRVVQAVQEAASMLEGGK